MDPHYETIGKKYSATRAADPRITERLIDLLALEIGSPIIDIGAGTGNYSWALADHGFHVYALEPSRSMRDQAKPHDRLNWIAAIAESLPIPDAQFKGAVMTLALHHLEDWQQGIREALRVTGLGPLVIFAFDTNHKAAFWLGDYFPQFFDINTNRSPSFDELSHFAKDALGITFTHLEFPLPKDLIDHFFSADWSHPENYLHEKFRSGISSFAKLDKQNLEQGLQTLRKDLQTGRWHQKYGELLDLEEYDQGYMFVRLGGETY